MKFDLQLFNEASDVGESTGDATVVSTGQGSDASQVLNQERTDDSDKVVDCGRLKLVVGENGRPVIQNSDINGLLEENKVVEQQEQQEQENETVLEEGEQQEGVISKTLKRIQETTPYTDQELALALQTNDVDESRIPAHHLIAYGQYKAKQEMMLQQPVAGQGESVQEQQSMKGFYTRIDMAAQERALIDAGLTAEDLDAATYTEDDNLKTKIKTYETALAWHKQQIALEIQQKSGEIQQRRAMQDAIYQDIQDFTMEAKKNEPNFDKIDAMLGARYQKLPYEEAQEIAKVLESYRAGTITPEECKVMQKYYEDTRVAYYAQVNNLTTTPNKVRPPVVEKSGGGAESNSPVDYSQLRSLNVRDRRQWIANLMQSKK